MRFILRFLSICSVFSLFLIPAYALMEEDSYLTKKNARPSFFQAQTNVLIPDNQENPRIAIARYQLVACLTKAYGGHPKDAPVHAAVTEIMHNLEIDHSLMWPVYQATYNFYNLLSQSIEDTKYVMLWTVKFIKSDMDDQSVMHVASLIHEYMEHNSTEDHLLMKEELSDIQHPLSRLVENSQQWTETGEAYIKKLSDSLVEALKGWETL